MTEEKRHDYEGAERRYPDKDNWVLDKKIPLGFILALILQTVVITIAFQDVKRDVALNTAQILVLKLADAQNMSDVKEERDLSYRRHLVLEAKLDRLIERVVK